MDSKPVLVLYGTSACHLCDDAKALLWEITPNISFEEYDIALDDLLFDRYGVRIPVLAWVKSESIGKSSTEPSSTGSHEVVKELCWPFSIEDVLTFL